MKIVIRYISLYCKTINLLNIKKYEMNSVNIFNMFFVIIKLLTFWNDVLYVEYFEKTKMYIIDKYKYMMFKFEISLKYELIMIKYLLYKLIIKLIIIVTYKK